MIIFYKNLFEISKETAVSTPHKLVQNTSNPLQKITSKIKKNVQNQTTNQEKPQTTAWHKANITHNYVTVAQELALACCIFK